MYKNTALNVIEAVSTMMIAAAAERPLYKAKCTPEENGSLKAELGDDQ
jgi:hypothetical protein